MAAFTSTQTGNWDDGATWGNTSPGVKGTDWPGLAGDTAIIANTHVVTYNVYETNQLGDVTIDAGGELTWVTSMDTRIELGTAATFIIAGTITIGSSGTPIDKAYTAYIVLNATSNAEYFNCYADSIVSIYGDSDFYGSTFTADVASDWTSGQTFTVTGDLTSTWAVGNTLALLKDGASASASTDMVYVTIASLALNGSDTDITINEAFPSGSYSTDSIVYNIGRNVIIALNGSTTIVNAGDSSSARAYLRGTYDSMADINSAMFLNGYTTVIYGAILNDVTMIGFYEPIDNIGNPEKVEINNLFYAYTFTATTSDISFWTGSNILFYNVNGLYFNNCNLSNVAITSSSYISAITFSNLELHLFKNSSTSEIFQIYNTVMSNISVVSGENQNGLSYTEYDIFEFNLSPARPYYDIFFQKLNSSITTLESLISVVNSSTVDFPYQVQINDFNDGGPVMTGTYGKATYETADGSGSLPSQRSGGNSEVWQIITYSNITFPRKILVPIDFNYYTTASSTKTFRVYFQTDYTSEAKYIVHFYHPDIGPLIDEGTISTRASSSDWTQYAEFASQNFTTAAWVKISVYVWGYEASNYIWVDPLVEVS